MRPSRSEVVAPPRRARWRRRININHTSLNSDEPAASAFATESQLHRLQMLSMLTFVKHERRPIAQTHVTQALLKISRITSADLVTVVSFC